MIEVVFTDSNSFSARCITAFTWSNYRHVGFYDRKNGSIIDSRSDYGGVSEYSFEKLKEDYSRILVRSFPNVPLEALNIARSQIGKPYDWTALAGIGLHRDWQETNKWFCSELVTWACQQTGADVINKQSWRVTPQDVLEVSSAALFE